MMDKKELEIMGFEPVYDYTQFSHDYNVNVIPEHDFKKLVHDTFKTIAGILRNTYGPYGSTVMISTNIGETVTTKDGYNVFEAIGFSHHYKRMVYLAIKKIIERVNRNVGDGTTSCILLADKLFNNINKIIRTSDEKRKTLEILSDIEKHLLDPEIIECDKEDNIISYLDKESLYHLINLANNYDDELTNVIMEALSPEYDNDCKVIKIRNVIPEQELDYTSDGVTRFNVDKLPGNYRVRINMDTEFGLSLSKPTNVKIALYDHGFTSTDWTNFNANYDKETLTIIMARAFSNGFMDNEYLRYMKERSLTKQPVKIYLCELKGDFQTEIRDLAAVLKCNINTLNFMEELNHDTLPTVSVCVYKNDCMCFDINPSNTPTEYIEKIREELKNDKSGSYINKRKYLERIEALELKSEDSIISVVGSSSLELKMLMDKIDDCISIVKSAYEWGTVPNMFQYGDYRMSKYIKMCLEEYDKNTDSVDVMTLKSSIANSIKEAISELFTDIWKSKFDDSNDSMMSSIKNVLYNGTYDYEHKHTSYNIIADVFVPSYELPTSSQYDLEVIAASISIVKYLLTSRALVFDANLMQMTGDKGHYKKMD